jgi:hypothetical protein
MINLIQAIVYLAFGLIISFAWSRIILQVNTFVEMKPNFKSLGIDIVLVAIIAVTCYFLVDSAMDVRISITAVFGGLMGGVLSFRWLNRTLYSQKYMPYTFIVLKVSLQVLAFTILCFVVGLKIAMICALPSVILVHLLLAHYYKSICLRLTIAE